MEQPSHAEAKPARKRYRVSFDRAACIGAATCVSVYPEQWSLDNEGKAVFAKEFFDKEEYAKQLEAAQVCPTNAIHIYDEETGEKII